jgi:hypothetical protein
VKRILLTDGEGIPLSVVARGASLQGPTLLAAALDVIIIERPAPSRTSPNVSVWT